MSLTSHQIGLLVKHATAPRRTVRFCNTCGGTHKGDCILVSTTHGTRVRPDLVDTVEANYRERGKK